MKNKHICLFSCVILALSMNVFAQNLLDWPLDPFGRAYRVDASYGPRDLGGQPGTFFHKGLDLNGVDGGSTDLNYPLLAEADGTVFGIGMAKSTPLIKWMGVNYGNNRTFAYLHIFPDDNSTSKGNFVQGTFNRITKDNEIKSYRRMFTNGNTNRGVILFYSGLNSTGRIVKSLGISGIHETEVLVPNNTDRQATPYGAETADATSLVVCPAFGKPLETTPRGKNFYDSVTGCILAGESKKAESHAGYVLPSTTVVRGEIIAPLGLSGAYGLVHLHLQISAPDEILNNAKNPKDLSANDGWDNVIQYLAREHSAFSGGISLPAANAVRYHTDSHDFERVTAYIRQRPSGAIYGSYHAYELDRIKLFAIPPEVVTSAEDLKAATADNTYLINGSREMQTPASNKWANPGDPFRAEFDYGGSYAANDNAFPSFINNNNYSKSDGSRTGLLPEGSLESKPITDFVFNQWNTRIRADYSGMAYRNQDAAYHDGWCGLVATAESVDRDPNEKFVSQPTGVNIDNFRPYVEQVTIADAADLGNTVYSRVLSSLD